LPRSRSDHRAGAPHFQSWLRHDGWEAFEIAAQIVCEYEAAPSAFADAQCARTNRLVESRPTDTRDGGRFRDGVGKR
jgi:hypothetical protein